VFNSGTLKCYTDIVNKNIVNFKLKDIREMRRVGLTTENFDFSQVNFKALECIFTNIEKISQILLVLEPPRERVSLEKMARLFSLIFGKPQDLTDLTIYLHQDDDDLMMMLNALMAQFSGLKVLRFNFYPEEHSFNNCEDFVQNLSFLAPRLEKLDLLLPSCPISALQNLFISMPRLEEFVLDVRGMKSLDDVVLDMMMKDVKTLMPKLRKFELGAVGTGVTSSCASTLRLQMKFILDLEIITTEEVSFMAGRVCEREERIVRLKLMNKEFSARKRREVEIRKSL